MSHIDKCVGQTVKFFIVTITTAPGLAERSTLARMLARSQHVLFQFKYAAKHVTKYFQVCSGTFGSMSVRTRCLCEMPDHPRKETVQLWTGVFCTHFSYMFVCTSEQKWSCFFCRDTSRWRRDVSTLIRSSPWPLRDAGTSNDVVCSSSVPCFSGGFVDTVLFYMYACVQFRAYTEYSTPSLATYQWLIAQFWQLDTRNAFQRYRK